MDTIESLKAHLEEQDLLIEDLHDVIRCLRDEKSLLNGELDRVRAIHRRLLAEASDEIEAERKRIIAASDAAFRYISKRK